MGLFSLSKPKKSVGDSLHYGGRNSFMAFFQADD